MKTYFIQVEGTVIRFNAHDGCEGDITCPIKKYDDNPVGFTGSSFICHICKFWKGIDIPKLIREGQNERRS